MHVYHVCMQVRNLPKPPALSLSTQVLRQKYVYTQVVRPSYLYFLAQDARYKNF